MTTKATLDVLASVPLLARLDKRSLRQLAGQFKDRTIAAGEHATDEGVTGVGFFIVLEGTATVSIGGAEVAKLGPHDWFGEMALFTSGGARSATITADTDLHCVGLTPWHFRPFLAENPDIAWTVMETMARRIAQDARD